MEQHIINDWQRAVVADPRISELAEAAYRLVREGDEHTHTADYVYGDMKPHLARLVGWNRGGPPPERGMVHIPESPDVLLPVVSDPHAGQAEDEEFLCSDRAYDVCHDVIFTELCEIYDQRWSKP
jgi:hypothetical protein